VPRVLIGDFGAIARLGLREFFDEEGFEVVAEEEAAEGIMERLTVSRPDVVVVDLDDHLGVEIAGRIALHFPAMKVIACSAQDPTMRVFPPFHHGESYLCPLSPALLAEAVRS
jgi:DNA-binding NarL/FixJ family response regulator